LYALNQASSSGLKGFLWGRLVTSYTVYSDYIQIRPGNCRPEMDSKADEAQEHAEATVNLPEDDPALLNLYIQFLYEAEYEPRLPLGITGDGLATHVVTAKRSPQYTYEFPHDCLRNKQTAWICPHHICNNKRREVDFICKGCCVDVPPSGNAEHLLLHTKMYQMGDKLGTESLKAIALQKFRRACCFFWDSDEFARAAHHAFSSTPDSDMGLREVVAETISQHLKIFHKPAVEALVQEFHDLAVAVVRLRAREATKGSVEP
jgi:hypothetical protein